MTYGPSPETGKVYQRFGPINLEHGHRRLNVLFSRARERMIVFSSMKASEVLVGESSKLGVKALSGFLEYSETGILPGRVVPVGSGREPDSDFEIAVAEALRLKGYEVVAQLGVDGFFLDLAVKDPEAPQTYLIGIECDGASYHSSKSARDRDRLRQDILEGLGWRIERIWSTDWFQEPGRELSRIIDAIEDEKARRIAQRQRPMSPERRSPPSVEEDISYQDGAEQEEDSEYLDPDDTVLEEAPAQDRRMSRSEARDVLIRLREDTIKPSMPEVPPERGLLRKVMLETLLAHLPQDETEFRDMIPLKLREGTDSEQFSTFGKIVFRILRQVSA
jgi:very-short-patch-repair endonuclease